MWHNEIHDGPKYLKRAMQVSVTGNSDDGIPHGLKGYRAPYCCTCDVCRAANAQYSRDKRAEYAAAKRDELATKREARYAKSQGKERTAIRQRQAAATVSGGTVPKSAGPMERAVIEECEGLERAKIRPTLVIAARNLAKIVDTPKMSSIHTSTTKQIMAILADLHGDTAKAKATGRRKSGGRLATVGALTKVKRA